jgi:hexosaminidase
MKTFLKQLIIILAGIFIVNTGNVFSESNDKKISIIPKPLQVNFQKGHFLLTPQTKIIYFKNNSELKFTVDYLAKVIRASTGYNLPIKDGFKMPSKNFVFFNYIHDENLGEEGYKLEVDIDKICIGANSSAGFLYAVQSILELLPTEIYGGNKVKQVQWKIPCLSIIDKPRFQWRGMHLDVSRHFFPIEFIKTYIDMLALHKMNVFHWHLTDDQGWRIEIKKYPKLTSVGAWRVDREDRLWNDREPQHQGENATYGGFYTQDEIKEIVKYAADRQITIVPEIEMPAHSGAALAAYPEFSCTGGPFTVSPGGVWPITNLYCAGNDSTFDFLKSILNEVVNLFPGKFIHIGGDEADKTEWTKCTKCQARIKAEKLKDESELQSYFIKRIEKFIVSKNRRIIGWDEILDGGIAPEATVMSWRGMDGGIAAARMNHDVVMTPGSHCYFDYYQGKPDFEPLAIGGYTPLKKVYEFEPISDSLTYKQSKHILGAQANVWTEFIATPEHVQYMTLPRMAAMAEALWSPKEMRDWNEFILRAEVQMERYAKLKYNYAKSAYLVSISASLDSVKKEFGFELSNEMQSKEIRYTLDGKEPIIHSSKYLKPFNVNKSTVVKAVAFHKGKPIGAVSEQKVYLHKALFKPVTLKYAYYKYSGGGDLGLTNGIRGTKSYNDGNWQGFEQNDLEAIIDLGDVKQINSISTSFLQNTNSWIFFPVLVEYAISEDGTSYSAIRKFEQPVTMGHREVEIKEFSLALKDAKARFIKVIAKNIGQCPDWHVGKGGKAWLFIDEIVVE